MKSIIDELYYENLPVALMFRWTSEHRHDSAEHTKAADAFRETLDSRRLQTFNELEQQMTLLTCHETKEYFHMGFCLGALFLLEVMQFRERLD